MMVVLGFSLSLLFRDAFSNIYKRNYIMPKICFKITREEKWVTVSMKQDWPCVDHH